MQSQDEVKAEQAELNDKIEKLNEFFGTETFDDLDPDEQRRLEDQHEFMTGYWDVLDERIAAFK